jgi:hypothetical protein
MLDAGLSAMAGFNGVEEVVQLAAKSIKSPV